jgi:2-dehydro-3-deoxy-D-arabinonate dehydratase
VILYRLTDGWVVEQNGKAFHLDESLDHLLARPDPQSFLEEQIRTPSSPVTLDQTRLRAPIESQEVWAAGVTYFRSRVARMEESEQASSFYDRVYSAERPELFFKCMPAKVVGPNAPVAIRRDATWSVPEPELVLVISPKGKIVGYTIGNDMSSRDIEGKNPLYLPQAKIYDRSCAIGPGILVQNEPLPPTTRITLTIDRGGAKAFESETALSAMKRRPEELVEYLYCDQTFSAGCFLFTGTGIVPPDSFTLERGDVIRIGIDGIGVLENPVG